MEYGGALQAVAVGAQCEWECVVGQRGVWEAATGYGGAWWRLVVGAQREWECIVVRVPFGKLRV